jgi:hypothetical protein
VPQRRPDDPAQPRHLGTQRDDPAGVGEQVVGKLGGGAPPPDGWAADLISQEVADKVGKVWGLGSGTTKDPGPQQDGLWFHEGNLHQSRHYSLYLALQLKARLEGIATPVYGLQEVHHTS